MRKWLASYVLQGEIFCLLGRNGAAKSTTLSAIARLLGISGGSIRYADDLHIGIASQKDVLWDELDCRQVISISPLTSVCKLIMLAHSVMASYQDDSAASSGRNRSRLTSPVRSRAESSFSIEKPEWRSEEETPTCLRIGRRIHSALAR